MSFSSALVSGCSKVRGSLAAFSASWMMALITGWKCRWPNITAPSMISSDSSLASDSTISTASEAPATPRSSWLSGISSSCGLSTYSLLIKATRLAPFVSAVGARLAAVHVGQGEQLARDRDINRSAKDGCIPSAQQNGLASLQPRRVCPADGQCRDVVQRGLNGQDDIPALAVS